MRPFLRWTVDETIIGLGVAVGLDRIEREVMLYFVLLAGSLEIGVTWRPR
jgi:hypothetical protein